MKNLAGLTPAEKKEMADRLTGDGNVRRPDWFDGKRVDEVAYCESLLARREMRCVHDRLYSMDGEISEESVKAMIAADLKPFVRSFLYKTVDRVLQALKVLCKSEPIPPTADRIHFRNGTWFTNGLFVPIREWTMNRMPISYDPDAPSPERWTRFLSELLEEEDIPTLQEFLGYCMTTANLAQSMLMIIGKGGEGKSRISAVAQEMFGTNLNMGSICKLESDKFCLANLEGKLLFIDDDIRMAALSSTNTIKTVVSCEGAMELERKNKQSYQGIMYAKLLCIGNATLKSLYDKSNGFYRRQIILQTKPKPADRVDDPYLKDKLMEEIPGILLWCLEGLQRLTDNHYRFTISEKARRLKDQYMEEDNNIRAFLESEGYIEFSPEVQCTTQRLYGSYIRWCQDNAEKPVATSTFSQYLKENAEELHIRRDKNIPNGQGKRVRGYQGIRAVGETESRWSPEYSPTPFEN